MAVNETWSFSLKDLKSGLALSRLFKVLIIPLLSIPPFYEQHFWREISEYMSCTQKIWLPWV